MEQLEDNQSVFEEIKNHLARLDELENLIKELKKIDPQIEPFNNLALSFNQIKHTFLLNKKIRIPILGVYSSGKSTVINRIVGKDILPTKETRCTSCCVIINHWNKKETVLYRSKFTKIENYFIFQEDEVLAQGVKNVRAELEILNNKDPSDSSEDFFYVIKTKIEFFESLEEDISTRIELIDFPGINSIDDSNDLFTKEVYHNLVWTFDFFIFIIVGDLINNKDNSKIIKDVFQTINTKTSQGISVRKSLFISNKYDLIYREQNRVSNESIKNTLADTFSFDKNEINVVHFSNKLYCDSYVNTGSLKSIKNEFILFKEKKPVKNFKDHVLSKLNYCCKKSYEEIKETVILNHNSEKELEDYRDQVREELREVYNENVLREKPLKLGFNFDDNTESFNQLKALYDKLAYFIYYIKHNFEEVISNNEDYKNSNFINFRKEIEIIISNNYSEFTTLMNRKITDFKVKLESIINILNYMLQNKNDVASINLENLNIKSSKVKEIADKIYTYVEKGFVEIEKTLENIIYEYIETYDKAYKMYELQRVKDEEKYKALVEKGINSLNEAEKLLFENWEQNRNKNLHDLIGEQLVLLINKNYIDFQNDLQYQIKLAYEEINLLINEINKDLINLIGDKGISSIVTYEKDDNNVHGYTHLAICGVHAASYLTFLIPTVTFAGPVGLGILIGFGALHGLVTLGFLIFGDSKKTKATKALKSAINSLKSKIKEDNKKMTDKLKETKTEIANNVTDKMNCLNADLTNLKKVEDYFNNLVSTIRSEIKNVIDKYFNSGN